MNNVRGQSYDGASNLASECIAVQALVKEKSPLAVNTLCHGHCLNSVVGGSCTIPILQNVVGKVLSVCSF